MLKTAIDLMERGYVPDWLTRIGIRRLLAERLRAAEAGDDQAREAALARLEAELRASPIALHTGAGQRAALRSAGRLFPENAGTATEIQLLLVAGGSPRPGNRRSRHAGAELRAGGTGFRSGHSGTGLRLGFADAVDGGVLSRFADRGGVELQFAAGIHRGALPGTRLRQRPGHHRRHERVFHRPPFRPGGVGGNVRAHAQLSGIDGADSRLAETGRQAVRPHLHPPATGLSVRNRGRGQLDGAVFLHRRADALARSAAALPGRSSSWKNNGISTVATTSAPWKPGWSIRIGIGRTFWRCSGRPTVPNEAERWFQRWRVFFMACAELFGYRDGEEWGVSHYRFGRQGEPAA